MGADMSISALAYLTGTTFDWDAGSAWIDGLSPERVSELIDDFAFDGDVVREILHEALARTREAIGGWNRESTHLRFGEWTIYLTGGLSWGDPPTDLYNRFWMLDVPGGRSATSTTISCLGSRHHS